MAVAPDRGIYLLGERFHCDVTCATDVYLLRRHPDGSPDSDFGNGGIAYVLRNVERSWFARLAVDSAGRALVALADPDRLFVVRIEPNGNLDPSFGEGGVTVLPCACREAALTVRLDPAGRILVAAAAAEFVSRPPAPSYISEKLMVTRLLPNGAQDTGFGQRGWVESVSESRRNPTASFVGADGSLVLAGPEESSAGLYLMRIGPQGAIDGRFDRNSHRALELLHPVSPPSWLEARALIARGDGAIDVFASPFVLRVRRDGHFDRRFAEHGVERIPWQVDAAVPAGEGRVVAAGSSGGTGEAFVLNARDHRDRSFHDGRPISFKDWHVLGDIAMQGRRPLLFDDGSMDCRNYCPPQPKLVRLTALSPVPRHHHHR